MREREAWRNAMQTSEMGRVIVVVVEQVVPFMFNAQVQNDERYVRGSHRNFFHQKIEHRVTPRISHPCIFAQTA